MTLEEKVRAIIAKIDPETVETIVKVIVKTSVAGTVTLMIHAYCPTTTKTQKVKLVIGAFAMSQMVGEKCGDWAYEKLESFVKAIKDLFAMSKESSTAS